MAVVGIRQKNNRQSASVARCRDPFLARSSRGRNRSTATRMEQTNCFTQLPTPSDCRCNSSCATDSDRHDPATGRLHLAVLGTKRTHPQEDVPSQLKVGCYDAVGPR